MSRYTTSIEVVINSQSNNSDNIWERIESGRKFLFDFPYEAPSDDFKKSFETQFIEKYWQESIGYETFPLFKMKLKQRLEMLMPEYIFKYNELNRIIHLENPALERHGKSTEIAKGKSESNDVATSTGKQTSKNTASSSVSGSNEAESSSSQKTVSSDLPASVINAQTIGAVTYADGGSLATGSDSSSGSNSSEGSSESNITNNTENKNNAKNNSNYENTVERIFEEYGSELKAFDFILQTYQNLMRNLLEEFDDMFIQLLY